MYRDRKLNLSSVHQAAEEGSIPKVEQLLAHYLKRGNNELTLLQEKEDLMGVQPLQIAAERGHLKFVKVSHSDVERCCSGCVAAQTAAGCAACHVQARGARLPGWRVRLASRSPCS